MQTPLAIELRTLFVAQNAVALRWAFPCNVYEAVTFSVWRSGSAQTGFEKIKETDEVQFLDEVDLTSLYKPTYYKVTATVGGQPMESNVSAVENLPNSDVTRLQKRERFMLAKFEGVPALLYVRKRIGRKCPRCVTSQGLRDEAGLSCTLCFATGVEGGYYTPTPIYLAKDTLAQKGVTLREGPAIEGNSANVWTSNWTLVTPEDVIIEMVPPNTIWLVTGAQVSERYRSPVRQLLTVNQDSKDTQLFSLPVPQFLFPARSEVFMHSFEDGMDFDNLFKGLLYAYRQENPSVSVGLQPISDPGQAQRPSGQKDPVTGFFS